jgi:hypothetical protein
MADGPEFNLGALQGAVEFDVPRAEMDKLDEFADQAPELTAAMEDFQEGAELISDASLRISEAMGALPQGEFAEEFQSSRDALQDMYDNFDMMPPEEEQEKVDQVSEQAGMMEAAFSAFQKGGGAMMAGFGALAVLFSGEGFKQVFKLLGDILGLFSDLLFISLLPVIRPLMETMQELARFLVDLSSQEGGILGALFGPEAGVGIASILIGGLLKMSAGLMEIGTQIVEGMLAKLRGERELIDDDSMDFLQEGASEFMDTWVDYIKSLGELFMEVIVLFKDSWMTIGEFIADGFLSFLPSMEDGKFHGMDMGEPGEGLPIIGALSDKDLQDMGISTGNHQPTH